MQGPDTGSTDITVEDLEHSNLANGFPLSSRRHERETWAEVPFEMPLACSDFLDLLSFGESASSSGVITSRNNAPMLSPQVLEPGNIQTTAHFGLCETPCSTILSAAHASPVGDVLPPRRDAPDAPTLSFMSPSWAEAESTGPQSTGNLQGTAATGAVATPVQGAVRLAVAAEPLNTESLLPRASRVSPAPKATKSRSGFAQRNRVCSLLSCSLS